MSQPVYTEAELELVAALHRAQYEELSKIFGEKYEPLGRDELLAMAVKVVPLVRQHVQHELKLALQRESVLRMALESGE